MSTAIIVGAIRCALCECHSEKLVNWYSLCNHPWR